MKNNSYHYKEIKKSGKEILKILRTNGGLVEIEKKN